MIATGIAEILCLVYVFERRRDGMHAELDSALADLDNQTQTIVMLVESTCDVIVLVDHGRRVVLGAVVRESFVLELPHMAPRATVASSPPRFDEATSGFSTDRFGCSTRQLRLLDGAVRDRS
jgi:hypothetical protein